MPSPRQVAGEVVSPGLPVELKGKDQIRQAVQGYFTAFPDCQMTVKNLIESGD